MKYISLFILVNCANAALGNLTSIFESTLEEQRIDMIVDIITLNLKKNGWDTILCYGTLPDAFYNKIQHISYAFVVMNLNYDDEVDVEDFVPYHSNVILISCQDTAEYEKTMQKLTTLPYWHPLANIILYYHKMEDREVIAKLFFCSWYYKAINTIIVQYNDEQKSLMVSNYTPYVNENYPMQPDNKFGCWTARNIGMPVLAFDEGLICEEKCHNVSLHTKLRTNNLGTCIGFDTNFFPYNTIENLRSLKMFEDKSENLHGFMLRAYIAEIKPFFIIDEHENGTYTLHSRDGMIWNTMSELMNFGIDLTPSLSVLKKPFNFEVNIEQIFSFVRRKGDLLLFPIYQFDIILVEVDFTFPYKDSGVCIVSSRARFVTTIFEVKTVEANSNVIVEFAACFICIWGIFSIFKRVENGRITLDQIGKDLMNTFRNSLLINLHNPPRRQSFRLFLGISLWSFFVVNFTCQATIISFFTAVKRGKEVDTFEDIIEKGYPLEGMASPDLILPDTQEKFRIINSRLKYEQNVYGCVARLSNESNRFCLIDCSVARYLKRNKLNEKGEQYLHIAKDRMHSHYLAMVMWKHSPLTDRFNKYMMMIIEGGFIRKWEQYRYTDIKDDVTAKPLGIKDLKGIFELYCYFIGFTSTIFLLELVINRARTFLKKKL